MTVGRIPNIEGGIQPTLLTTTGDIMYASSASNPARLGIGSSAQVLTVASGVPSWATPSSGGMTLISTTSLTGAVTSISSIDQTYKQLVLYIYGVTNATANGVFFAIPYNGTTALDVGALAPSEIVSFYTNFSSAAGYRLSTDTSGLTLDRTNASNFWEVRFPNYASTTANKGYQVIGGYVESNAANKIGRTTLGVVFSNSAINKINLQNSAGNLLTGTALLYGVN